MGKNHLMKYVSKKWGYEKWYVNDKISGYCGKLLHIDQGQSLSLHYHIHKNETFLVQKGPVILLIWDTINNIPTFQTLETGETYYIEPGTPHSLFARDNDVEIIEFSTYHDDNDSYRCGVFKPF